MRKDALVFIMACGKGERLFPLTKDRAKPAVPFGGIFRIIDFTINNCINSGLRKIHVLTQYKSISLSRHIRLGWGFLPQFLDEYVDVLPPQHRINKEWYRGTADALYQNIYTIQAEHPKYIMILSGDHIYKMDYAEMIRYHKQKKAAVTAGAIEVPLKNAPGLGVIEVNDNMQIVGFQEKPANPRPLPADPDQALGSMGVYLFDTKILIRVLEECIPKGMYDFGHDILPYMLKSHRIVAYNFKDENKNKAKYWRDVGTIDAYYEANMDLASVSPIFNMYDTSWPLRTYHEQFLPVKTVFSREYDNRIGAAFDSIISPGVIISGGQVHRSVLSPNVRVNSYSRVEDSILFEGVNIARHAKIRRAIIDKNVNIPAHVEIGYNIEKDRKRYYVSDNGVVVIPKGAVVRSPKKR